MDHSMHHGHHDEAMPMDMEMKMDMKNCSGCDMGGMSMSFHFGVKEVVLFDFWKINTVWGLLISCAIIFLACLLYEALKWFRVKLAIRHRQAMVSSAQGSLNPSATELIPSRFRMEDYMNMARFIQTLLYGVQMIIAYLLMLVFMTYNVWLCIAVIVGEAVGYFLFSGSPRYEEAVSDCCG
uniref:Copper transport protein n=1 Tax=Plectus sambesii TaxID=2011161 RepID=A0A914XLH8_9BILA